MQLADKETQLNDVLSYLLYSNGRKVIALSIARRVKQCVSSVV